MRALSRAIAAPPAVAGVGTTSPMAGLERRAVGFVDVLAQSVGGAAPTAAATTLPALVASQAGPAVLLSMVLAWLLVGGVAYSVSQFTRRMAAPGSLYTFTTKGLGATSGFVAAASLIIGYGFIAMFSLVGAALATQVLLVGGTGPTADRGWVPVVAIMVFAGIVVVVLRRGIRLSARVTLVVEAVAIVLVLALLATILGHTHGSALTAPFRGGWPGWGHLIAGTAVAATAFVGFESAASLGREARRPFLAIPRTMRWTLVVIGALYVLSAYTQQAGTVSVGLPLANNDTAMWSLATDMHVPWMARLLEVGQATSFVACAIASLTALSRVLFTLAREGVLPEALGRADPLRGTPRTAILAVVPITALLPIVMLGLGASPWHAMSALVAVAAVGYLLAYLLTCGATPAFLYRIGELTWRPVVVAVLAATALAAGVGVYLVVIARQEPLALALLGVCAVVTAVAGVALRRWRRAALGSMGLFDETTVSDLLGAPEPLAAGER